MLARNPDGSWPLSRRELDCLVWTARGKTYVEIAAILGLRFGSVKTYLDTVRYKLNAVNVAQAVALGYETGIIKISTVSSNPLSSEELAAACPKELVLTTT